MIAALPHKIATLLYCFNERDEVLLMRRAQEPNLHLWSPPGGKLKTATGESPHTCAAREAGEELGLRFRPQDFRLTGVVGEQGYEGQAHWLMFLFELQTKLTQLPPPHREGTFAFYSKAALPGIDLPKTDREQVWPLFWRHRNGFFAASCNVISEERHEWSLEESREASPKNP